MLPLIDISDSPAIDFQELKNTHKNLEILNSFEDYSVRYLLTLLWEKERDNSCNWLDIFLETTEYKVEDLKSYVKKSLTDKEYIKTLFHKILIPFVYESEGRITPRGSRSNLPLYSMSIPSLNVDILSSLPALIYFMFDSLKDEIPNLYQRCFLIELEHPFFIPVCLREDLYLKVPAQYLLL